MSCIFQLPFTWQRLCRLGQLETQTTSRQGQARCAENPDTAHPRQWQGKRDVFIPECSAGWAHWFLTAALPPHGVPERKMCIYIKMASSLENKPSQGLSTLPTQLHRGS